MKPATWRRRIEARLNNYRAGAEVKLNNYIPIVNNGRFCGKNGFIPVSVEDGTTNEIYINYKDKVVIKSSNLYPASGSIEEVDTLTQDLRIPTVHCNGYLIQPLAIVNNFYKSNTNNKKLERGINVLKAICGDQDVADVHRNNIGIYKGIPCLIDW